jgi:hypothetical protein
MQKRTRVETRKARERERERERESNSEKKKNNNNNNDHQMSVVVVQRATRNQSEKSHMLSAPVAIFSVTSRVLCGLDAAFWAALRCSSP